MLRVGKIEYLNTVPVYYGFIKGVVKCKEVEFVEDVPSELNRLLREGFLDVSVVSSYEYITNWDKYLLLPDLSISAYRKVKSVLFFSKVPIHQLHRKDVWITRSSMTSRELLKYLLKNVYGVEPNFYYYSMKEGGLPKNPKALLAIGDDALKLLPKRTFPFVYDLAEEWFNLTGFPFVFAVWAVRRDSYEKKREKVRKFYRKLIKSRDFGERSFDEICSAYGKKIPLNKKPCRNYLNCLNFHLGEEEESSLKTFSEKIGKPFKLNYLEI
jgi:chorismate dehydratase